MIGTDSHTSKSQTAITGDMPDIDSVYNVVEHIDELRDYGWNRQLKKKLSDGFGS